MDNIKSTRFKISLGLNLLIVILTIFSSIIMFTGYKFMHNYDTVLESTRLGMLKFFTVQSNILMGIVALLLMIDQIKLINGKISFIKLNRYILNLMSTTAVALTFFVVFAYLGPISKDGILSLLQNSNLFFHLIIPLLSIINFICFEKSDKLKFKHTYLGVIPTVIYALFYITNILIHTEYGYVDPIYDWYFFVQNGVWTAFIVAPLLLLITYIISLLLWSANKIKPESK